MAHRAASILSLCALRSSHDHIRMRCRYQHQPTVWWIARDNSYILRWIARQQIFLSYTCHTKALTFLSDGNQLDIQGTIEIWPYSHTFLHHTLYKTAVLSLHCSNLLDSRCRPSNLCHPRFLDTFQQHNFCIDNLQSLQSTQCT